MDFRLLGLTPVSEDGKWAAIREARNRLLTECDWTQLPDAPLTDEQKQVWATYRQQLRDIPETFENPEAAEFPENPQ
jgi:hypothetical protein